MVFSDEAFEGTIFPADQVDGLESSRSVLLISWRRPVVLVEDIRAVRELFESFRELSLAEVQEVSTRENESRLGVFPGAIARELARAAEARGLRVRAVPDIAED